jgi:acyl carrier protein
LEIVVRCLRIALLCKTCPMVALLSVILPGLCKLALSPVDTEVAAQPAAIAPLPVKKLPWTGLPVGVDPENFLSPQGARFKTKRQTAESGLTTDRQIDSETDEESGMSVREIVLEEIQKVAGEQEKFLAPLTDGLALQDSGLDSLCFAILVSRLEDRTGRDPFSSIEEVRFPRTVGELIALYEEVLA